MRVRADEHVSLEIVNFVRRIALSDGWTFDSVLEAGFGGGKDVHWITAFMKSGGDAILSADRDFISLPPQIMAVFNTGAKVIHLPPKWQNAKCRMQASHILLWWPRIEKILTEMKPRECYRPPWNLKEDGELTKVQIDFQTAQRKSKQAARRGPGG